MQRKEFDPHETMKVVHIVLGILAIFVVITAVISEITNSVGPIIVGAFIDLIFSATLVISVCEKIPTKNITEPAEIKTATIEIKTEGNSTYTLKIESGQFLLTKTGGLPSSIQERDIGVTIRGRQLEWTPEGGIAIRDSDGMKLMETGRIVSIAY